MRNQLNYLKEIIKNTKSLNKYLMKWKNNKFISVRKIFKLLKNINKVII